METETKTPRLYEHRDGASGLLVIAGGTTGTRERVHVTREGLQAIVQAAYDEHGILASPSYALEAERAEATGCPCGMEGCSDRPAYVAEYRTGLQVGGL